MIPIFPNFKKLELSDRKEVDQHTQKFALYSDFEFGSLWSWDVKEEMEISFLNGNLVIKFTDYTTGEPFLTFLGTQEVNDTALKLLAHKEKGLAQKLGLVPEVSMVGLDTNIFQIKESPDHFDYVCEVERHVAYEHKKLKSHRKLLHEFTKMNPSFKSVPLDMTSTEVRSQVAEVYRAWDETKGFITTSEAFAYERFLTATNILSYSAIGVTVDDKLVGFHIVSLPPGTCANALFGKADISYRGVYATLDHAVARDLLDRGYTHMNIQQDLGIESLRKAKLALHPAFLLKKYSVSLR